MTTDADLFARIAELTAAHEDFCVATVVRTENATSAKAGAKALVHGDGRIEGFLGGACVQGAVTRAAAQALDADAPRLIRVKPGEEVVAALDVDGVALHKSGCPSGGTVDLFIEPMRVAPRVVVCGASPVAVSLERLARAMGYATVAVAAAGDLDNFDAAAARTFEGFDLDPLALKPRDFVVVATQGKRDREALGAALRSAAAYVAFVGSRRKAAVITDRLRESGLDNGQLARLAAPAGLNIHAIEPAEIALSIMAEIVATRRAAARADVREENGAASAG